MSLKRYAEGTEVPVERSRAEIESILTRYGATSFVSGFQPGRAAIMFVANDRHVRFHLPLPDPTAPEFTRRGKYGSRYSQSEQASRLAAETRRRWRALVLAIKSKLEVVSTGIATFEEEFLSHIVLPNGRTVAEEIGPGIETAYRTGTLPPLLPGLPSPERDR